MRRLRYAFLVMVAVLIALPGADPLHASAAQDQLTITVAARGNKADARLFSVVLLCDSEAEREQGLQGFRRLHPDEAALFVFSRPQIVTFWMGNVQYPIDIVFVGRDGTVVGVAPDCRPGSTAFYGSGVPVSWVVETTANSGIVFGDRIMILRNGTPE